MDSVIIKQNIYRHLLLVLGGIILTLASTYLLTGDFSDSDFAKHVSPLIIPVGTMGVLFSCTCTIYAVYRLFAKKDLLIIKEDGFIDHSTMASTGFTAWKDVTSIRLICVAKQKMIGVDVNHHDDSVIACSWYVRVLNKANVAAGFPPIAINLNSAKEKPEEIVIIMQRYLEVWKKNHNEKE
jgi:hypothetical protein